MGRLSSLRIVIGRPDRVWHPSRVDGTYSSEAKACRPTVCKLWYIAVALSATHPHYLRPETKEFYLLYRFEKPALFHRNMADEKIGKDVEPPGPNLFARGYGCLQSEAAAFDSCESKELVFFLPLIFCK